MLRESGRSTNYFDKMASKSLPKTFLHIQRTETGYSTKGTTAGFIGHRLRNPRRNEDEGIFVEWSWDGDALRIHSDRYGFQPLFYFANDREIAISDSIFPLLEAGAPRELDDAGLAAFLRLGFFLGEDTPFRAIRMVPPKADLEWRGGKLTVAGEITIVPHQQMERYAAMDAYAELFREAIRRRLPTEQPCLVPLSGGRDSRHIVLELCRQGARPQTCLTARYHPGPYEKNEVETAATVCDALGISHRIFDQPDPRSAAECRKNVLTNLSTFEHTWFLPIADYLNRTAATTYDGIGGDVLSAGHFLTPKRLEWLGQGQFTDLAEDLFFIASENLLDCFLHPDLARRFSHDLAFARFEEECRKHLSAANPIGSFYIFNRARRVASTCAYMLLPDVPFVYSPFLDHDVFDFLSSLPARMLVDHSFHTGTIQRAYPQYAKVPFAETRKSAGAHAHCKRYARDVTHYLFQTGNHRSMRRSYVFPRLIRCMFDSEYAVSTNWLSTMVLYFTQLEQVTTGAFDLQQSDAGRTPFRGLSTRRQEYVEGSESANTVAARGASAT